MVNIKNSLREEKLMPSINYNNFKKIRREYEDVVNKFDEIDGNYNDETADSVCVESNMYECNDLFERSFNLITKIDNTIQAITDFKIINEYMAMREELININSSCESIYLESKKMIRFGEDSDIEIETLKKYFIEKHLS